MVTAVAQTAPSAGMLGQVVRPGYKHTEAGIVPEDWYVVPLGEVVDFLDGQRRPVKAADRQRMRGNVPYYGASGVIDYVNDYIFDQDLILLGEDGENILSREVRLAFQISGKSWVNNHAHVLRPHNGVNHKFLCEYLESIDYQLYNSGTAQPKLNKKTCHKIPVALPPSACEQDAIAAALTDSDALILDLEQLIEKKRLIKQGAMQELLSGRRRLPGFCEEWDYVPFGRIFDFLPTATNSRADLGSEGDTYYVHYGDIHTRFHTHLDFAVSAPPKILRAKCPAAATLRNGDWIMADASEDFDGVGKSVEVRGLGLGDVAVAGLHTFLLRERSPTFVPGFKGHLGAAECLRKQYMRVMTGMKVYGVSKTALRDLLVPVPGADEQAALVEFLDDFNADIAALEARLEKARQIKQGMMQELLTGRVRLV